jgi:hypothetical protein
MKNYALILTTLGLWSVLAPYAEAQQPSAPIQQASPAPATTPPQNFGSMIASLGSATTGDFPGYAWTEIGRDAESAVSVVTFKTPEQATVDETAADLNILSFIFSQNLERTLGGDSETGRDYKLGIPMLLQTGGRWVEANYIEGFGAVFNLKVRFPLVPPSEADKESQTNQVDSEWEQARRALAGAPQVEFRHSNYSEKARHYNPKLVETLKKRVIELLKNAAHLRHVQPDEWVAVTFSGPPNALTRSPGANPFLGTTGYKQDPRDPSNESPAGENAGTGSAAVGLALTAGGSGGPKRIELAAPQLPERATLMTIRVKKRNADAFAANKMSEDDFFHAAEITTYLGPIVANGAANEYYLLQPR